MRQAPGPSTRIDLTGAMFSMAAPSAVPVTLSPHLVALIYCPHTEPGNGVFEVVFRKGTVGGRRADRPQRQPVHRRSRQVHLPPGQGRAGVRRVRPDLRPLPHRQGAVAPGAVHPSAPRGLTADTVGVVPTTLTERARSAAISLIRGFAMDAPLHAKSGHQGTAMALAPLAHVLYSRVMRHDPANPHWPDRDRFVLSNGHASILQYSMLYLAGYGLELDDIKAVPPVGVAHAGSPRGAPHDRASRSPPVRSVRASPTQSAWRSPSAACARSSATT